jgi:hypothetical protein
LIVGLCGGFTTFSAFCLQTLDLARDGRLLLAGANIVLSVVLCLVAAALGHWLATLSARHEPIQVFSTFHIRYTGAWMTPFRFL